MLFEKSLAERIASIKRALEEEKAMRLKVLAKNPEYQQRRVEQTNGCIRDLHEIEKAMKEAGIL